MASSSVSGRCQIPRCAADPALEKLRRGTTHRWLSGEFIEFADGMLPAGNGARRWVMAAIEERMVAVEVRTTGLEGTMADHNRAMAAQDGDLKAMIGALDARMERRFDSLDRRFMSVLALQFTTLLAILAAAFGVITRLM